MIYCHCRWKSPPRSPQPRQRQSQPKSPSISNSSRPGARSQLSVPWSRRCRSWLWTCCLHSLMLIVTAAAPPPPAPPPAPLDNHLSALKQPQLSCHMLHSRCSSTHACPPAPAAWPAKPPPPPASQQSWYVSMPPTFSPRRRDRPVARCQRWRPFRISLKTSKLIKLVKCTTIKKSN